MPSSPHMIAESVSMAEAVHQYLLDHLERRETIAELSDQFNTSQTKVKSSFRAEYGESVYVHIRRLKMEAAARLLLQSDVSVLEVAGQVGYENASKFARAFNAVMGMTPTKYRKKHREAVWQD